MARPTGGQTGRSSVVRADGPPITRRPSPVAPCPSSVVHCLLSVIRRRRRCHFYRKKWNFLYLDIFFLLFISLSGHNFWTAGPISSRKKGKDAPLKTLHFGHQFFLNPSKNDWVMIVWMEEITWQKNSCRLGLDLGMFAPLDGQPQGYNHVK